MNEARYKSCEYLKIMNLVELQIKKIWNYRKKRHKKLNAIKVRKLANWLSAVSWDRLWLIEKPVCGLNKHTSIGYFESFGLQARRTIKWRYVGHETLNLRVKQMLGLYNKRTGREKEKCSASLLCALRNRSTWEYKYLRVVSTYLKRYITNRSSFTG